MSAVSWILLACLLFTLLALLVSLCGWSRSKGKVGRENRQRQRRAVIGETEAEVLLAKLGYQVVDRQLSQAWTILIDDQPHRAISRADLLVERDGKRYVAEVKTGKRAPRPSQPATRRQLLEYTLVFDVQGVLLVDMEARTVGEVSFDWSDPDL